jgi:hypothetical protein
MNYKNAITMTTLSVIAVFAIVSFIGFDQVADAIVVSFQPSKMVFVENIATTAEFNFRDGSETSAFQQFTQTGGFGITTQDATARGKTQSGADHTGRTKPSFTLEKIAGGTPYLYEAADEAQKHILNSGMEFPYKFFDVTVYVATGGDVLRSFEYHACKITNYVMATRSDNEEGYTGKGFALVDQFTFECDGYLPLNPAMDKLKVVEHAKTISSSDLRSTDKWEHGFSVKP